jgi:hypothetical protein
LPASPFPRSSFFPCSLRDETVSSRASTSGSPSRNKMSHSRSSNHSLMSRVACSSPCFSLANSFTHINSVKTKMSDQGCTSFNQADCSGAGRGSCSHPSQAAGSGRTTVRGYSGRRNFLCQPCLIDLKARVLGRLVRDDHQAKRAEARKQPGMDGQRFSLMCVPMAEQCAHLHPKMLNGGHPWKSDRSA